MHVVVLAAREGWHTRELARALDARGHTGAIVPYEGLTASVGSRPGLRSGAAELDRADAVLARIIPSGSLEQIIFRVDALHRLEERGVPVVNSARTIERTVDKFWTSCLLEQCGIPTPDTVVCESPEEAMAAYRELRDVIVKPLFGSMGLGMVRVADEEMAYRVFRTVETIRGRVLPPAHGGSRGAGLPGVRPRRTSPRRDRAARRRMAHQHRARWCRRCAARLPEAWAGLAIRAAAAVGAEYAGVDLLPGRDGSVWVLEVNGIPGWQGLQEATGLDVAGALVDHLDRRGQ